jgi:hypothetical protein
MMSKYRLMLTIFYIFIFLDVPTVLFAVDTSYLFSLSDNHEGSTDEGEIISLILEQADKFRLVSKVIPLSSSSEYYSYSKNLEVYLGDINKPTILYLIPLNSSLLNISAALYLIEKLSENPPQNVSSRFIFLGAEQGKETYYPIGTRTFLNNFVAKQPITFIYFDFDQPTYTIYLANQHSAKPTFWTVKEVYHHLKSHNLAPYLPSFYRLIDNFSQKIIHSSMYYHQERISGVTLSSDMSKNKILLNPIVWSQLIATSFADWQLSLTSLNDDFDNHYLVIGSYFISETSYLAILIILFGLYFIIFSLNKKYTRLYLKVFRKKYREIIILWSFVFIFIFLSGLINETLLISIKQSDIWIDQPELFLISKTVFSITFIVIFFTIFLHFGISQSHETYGIAAFWITNINMLIFTIFDVTLIYPLLWSSLFVFIFINTPNLIFKHVTLLLTPIPLLINILQILNYKMASIINKLLFSDIIFNVIMSLIILPLILLFLSLHHIKLTKHIPTIIAPRILLILYIILISLYIFIYTQKYTINFNEKKQNVTIDIKEDISRANSTITFSSRYNLGSFNFKFYNNPNLNIPIINANKVFKAYGQPVHNINIDVDNQSYNNYTLLTITLNNIDILSYDLTLRSSNIIKVLDSSFPISIQDKLYGRIINILTGRNPPSTLIVQMTIEKSNKPLFIDIIAQKNLKSSPYIIIDDPRFKISEHLYISKTIEIKP